MGILQTINLLTTTKLDGGYMYRFSLLSLNPGCMVMIIVLLLSYYNNISNSYDPVPL